MGKTRKDLERDIRRWVPGNQRYPTHAKRAVADDLPERAKPFSAAADSETVNGMHPPGAMGGMTGSDAPSRPAIEGENAGHTNV